MNKLMCKECNSEELSFKVWVDKNFVIEGTDSISGDTDVWCLECEELVVY